MIKTRKVYTYEQDGVRLDFSFDENEQAPVQKVIFIGLLRRAIEDLDKEVGVG